MSTIISTLKRRQLMVVFETNEDLDEDILAMPLAEFAKRLSEPTLTFELTDFDDAEFSESHLTHLVVRDFEGEDEKDVVAWKFKPDLLQEDVEEVFQPELR